MLQIGETAPGFEAESTKGPVRLQDYIGKQPIVLIFYPRDDTPICTKQLCAVRDAHAEYEGLNAFVLGVNPGTLDSHQQFAGKYHYDFPIVADPGGQIRDWYKVSKGLPFLAEQGRVVYVIGTSGRIIFAKKGNRPTQEILAAIADDAETKRDIPQ